MTYLDRYSGMSDDELADWAQALFNKAALFPSGTAELVELRNITPFLIERLRSRIEGPAVQVDMPRLL